MTREEAGAILELVSKAAAELRSFCFVNTLLEQLRCEDIPEAQPFGDLKGFSDVFGDAEASAVCVYKRGVEDVATRVQSALVYLRGVEVLCEQDLGELDEPVGDL